MVLVVKGRVEQLYDSSLVGHVRVHLRHLNGLQSVSKFRLPEVPVPTCSHIPYEQSIDLSFYVPMYLATCLPISLPTYLHTYLPTARSVYLSICIYRYIYRSIYLSVYLANSLLSYRFIYRSIFLHSVRIHA